MAIRKRWGLCWENRRPMSNARISASRQMNGGLVRKSLSYSKQLRLLRAASSWEDWVYNLTRPVKTLRVKLPAGQGQHRWQARSPAMVAGLTDHIWTVKELLMTVVLPTAINTK